jgi:hypothetical protein
MAIRQGVSKDRWFVDCDTDSERVYVGVCHDFQKPNGIVSEPDKESIIARAKQLGWTLQPGAEDVVLAFCPGCVPLSIRSGSQSALLGYLAKLASPMTSRELALKSLRYR